MPSLRRLADAIEAWLRRALEGDLARWLGARVQPVDIARRLADAMEDRRAVGAGRVYVPNNYRVYLSPRTLAAFASSQTAIEEDLAAYVEARGHEAGVDFLGRVRVSLLADTGVGDERLRVEAEMLDRHGQAWPGAAEHTQAIPIAPAPPPSAAPALRLTFAGRQVELRAATRVTLGRALDNDVIIEQPTVSRHHARLLARGSQWLVEDLGSRHGTFVNGHRVTASLIRVGDQLHLGNQVVRVEAAPGDGTHEPD